MTPAPATRRLRALVTSDPDRARATIRDACAMAGSRPRAAAVLGIPLRTLHRLLVELHVEAPPGRPGRPRTRAITPDLAAPPTAAPPVARAD